MRQAGDHHGSCDAQDRSGSPHRYDVVRVPDGKEGTPDAGSHIEAGESPVAVHPFKQAAQNVEHVTVQGEVEHSRVQEHRHHQPPVFTAANVRPVGCSKILQNVRIRGAPGENFQDKNQEDHRQNNQSGDRPGAALWHRWIVFKTRDG